MPEGRRRPYRQGKTDLDSLEEIKRGRGEMFGLLTKTPEISDSKRQDLTDCVRSMQVEDPRHQSAAAEDSVVLPSISVLRLEITGQCPQKHSVGVYSFESRHKR
jgi:hypothetical protein